MLTELTMPLGETADGLRRRQDQLMLSLFKVVAIIDQFHSHNPSYFHADLHPGNSICQ
jgi:predicted unusual protein kinase regulating ubiquinone biosynthesis (AarF/ABC1/UbiB family)